MKPGPKEQQLKELRKIPAQQAQVTLDGVPLAKDDGTPLQAGDLQVGDTIVVSVQQIAAASGDPGLVAKAVRMYLRHRAHARERMRRLREKGKNNG